MQVSQIPVKLPIAFASSAGAGFVRQVPTVSQIGIQAGAASLTDGFPPVTFLPIGSGGTPPFGADTNGILRQITQWQQWVQAGGPIAYDASFSTSIGGYPKGATVASATTFGTFWVSTADNNTTNPDAGGANWQQGSIFGSASTGDIKPTLKTVADVSWVMLNDGTIGSASSGATTRANADTQPLYSVLWNNVSNSFAPVSGGRGGTAAADFAANKAIQLTLALGRVLGAAGAGSGLTNHILGQTAGEENHLLTIPEMPAHTHGPGLGQQFAIVQSGGVSQIGGGSGNGSTPLTASTGGGGSHNNIQPTTYMNWMVKL